MAKSASIKIKSKNESFKTQTYYSADFQLEDIF